MDRRLFNAARSGSADRIQELVEQDPNILFGVTSEGNTVLHLAVRLQWKSQEKICELCPTAILTHCNTKGQTALHSAILGRNLKAVIMITSKVVDVEQGRVEVLKQMVRAADSNGDTALHLALRDDVEDAANKLIDLDGHGLSNLVNNKRESPLYLAALRGASRVVKRLLEFAPSNYRGPPPNNPPALHAAVAADDGATAQELLKKMPQLDKETDGTGFTPLHQAARSGLADMVMLLLDHDPSTGYCRDSDGNMAIHTAARHGHLKAFRVLYAFCPDTIDAVNRSGENILHCGVKHSYSKVVQEIANKTAFITMVNQQDNNGNTPLHRVILSGEVQDAVFTSVVTSKLLILSIVNNDGYTARDLYCSRISQFSPPCRDLLMILFAKNKDPYEYTRLLWEERYEGVQKHVGNVSLVATLMATITFAAAFTMPGGYSSDDGKAVLFRNAALQGFIVSDTISMCCSLLVAFVLSSPVIYKTQLGFYFAYAKFSTWFMRISFVAMLIAFATGMYAVLAPKCLWLGILVCIMCSVLPFIAYRKIHI